MRDSVSLETHRIASLTRKTPIRSQDFMYSTKATMVSSLRLQMIVCLHYSVIPIMVRSIRRKSLRNLSGGSVSMLTRPLSTCVVQMEGHRQNLEAFLQKQAVPIFRSSLPQSGIRMLPITSIVRKTVMAGVSPDALPQRWRR